MVRVKAKDKGSAGTISFAIHYGGMFVHNPLRLYVQGKKKFHYNYDTDRVSYFELVGLVKDVHPNPVKFMYYRLPCKSINDGLMKIQSDKDVNDLINCSKSTPGFIEIYVEHKNDNESETGCGDVGSSEVKKTVRDVTEIETEFVGLKNGVIDKGKGKQIVNKIVRRKGRKNKGYETDDDWEVASLDHMSDLDDDDEEVQLRVKLHEFYKPTKPNNNNSENQGECSDQQENNVETSHEKDGVSNDKVGESRGVHSEVDDMLSDLRHISGERDLSGYHSEYDNDSDYKTSSDDSSSNDEDSDKDESEDIDKILRYPIFDKEHNWKEMEPIQGMRAADVSDMHFLISCYAIDKGYDIGFKKRDRTRLVAKCNNCTWYCRSSWMQMEKSFQIKTLVNQHTCVRNFNSKLVTANWLARQFANAIRDKPRMKISDMKKDAFTLFKVEVTEDMCSRAKKKAFVEIDSALKQHYCRLWDYGAECLRTNPGSSMTFKDEDRVDHSTPAIFESAYICFDALKKGWLNGCRPIIGLDGCFLKTFVKGQLLSAVGRDGNNHIFPIAWAVVESENFSSWCWFTEQLKDDLGNNFGAGWTILSDRQKGLIPVVQQLLPESEHKFCARHVYANFRKLFSGVALRNLFWTAAKCGTVEEFEKVMLDIKSNNVLAYDWLIKSDPQTWARAYFTSSSSCDSVENNLSECFNSYILEARQKPIINMLEEIRQALMKRLYEKKEMLLKLHDKLCPRIRKLLEKKKEKFRNWRTINNGAGNFEVTYGSHGSVFSSFFLPELSWQCVHSQDILRPSSVT